MAVQTKKKSTPSKKPATKPATGKVKAKAKPASKPVKAVPQAKKPVKKDVKKEPKKAQKPVVAPKKIAVKPAKPTVIAQSFSRPPVARPVTLSPFGSAGQTIPPRLQAMLDKADLRDIVTNFARALDRMDDTLLRSVFHPEASVDFGPGVFQGSSNEYVPWALGVISQAKSTHHLLGQTRAQIEGDTAFVETYAQIHLRSDKPTGREDLFMGVRYLDRMERRPSGASGVWKIAHRKQVLDWVRTEAVSDLFFHQNPDALWSHRSKTDPSDQMAQFPSNQPMSGKLPSFLGRRYESKSFRF